MVARLRTSIEAGINYYVPRQQSAYGVQAAGPTEFSLGSPATAAAGVVQAAAFNAVNVAAGTKTFLTAGPWIADSPYGRGISPVISGDPGASGAEFDVCGYDYLGQPMAQKFTVANGGAVMVPAVNVNAKAFYKVTHVINRIDTTNAVTLAIGTGAELGLPYKGRVVYAKELATLAYITTALAEASWVQPVLTDPQTGLTGDPRGTYNGNTAPDGTPRIVGIMGDTSYNTNGNGGLHGIRHWAPSDF